MQEQTADNASAAGVPSAGTADAGSGAAVTNAKQNETAVPNTAEQTEKTPSDAVTTTKAFSRRLNELSERKANEAREALRKEYAGHDALLKALNESGYEGSAEEVAARLASEANEKKQNANSPTDNKETTDGKESRQAPDLSDIQKHPAMRWAREIIDERTFESDLAAIKAVYPDVAQKSVWELGDVYLRLMLSGAVDAVTAYEAQLASDTRNARTAPPSTGSAGAGGMKPEKEFYTPEEVDRLSRTDYDNPRIMERVRRSMTKWR